MNGGLIQDPKIHPVVFLQCSGRSNMFNKLLTFCRTTISSKNVGNTATMVIIIFSFILFHKTLRKLWCCTLISSLNTVCDGTETILKLDVFVAVHDDSKLLPPTRLTPVLTVGSTLCCCISCLLFRFSFVGMFCVLIFDVFGYSEAFISVLNFSWQLFAVFFVLCCFLSAELMPRSLKYVVPIYVKPT